MKLQLFLSLLIIVLGVSLVGVVGSLAQNAPVASPVQVTVNQVKAAGFTNVTVQAQAGTRYPAPDFYFRVKEKAPTIKGELPADEPNLVAVLVRPMTDQAWSYNNGQPEVRDVNGKTQVRLSKPGFYMVVTGPDKTKVTNLANNLKNAF